MTRSLSGLGFRAPMRGLGEANSPLAAGGYTHLASSPFNQFEYWIAPNRIPVRAGMHGLGDNRQIIMSAPSIAGGILTAGGATSIAATAWGSLAIPIVGAAVAAVTFALSLILNRKGPAQKIATTHIVDAIENGFSDDAGGHHPGLKENLIGYMTGPRTAASQAQALANFDAGWAWVQSHCNTAEMGEPGQRCTNDRQAGACKWTRGAGDPMQQYDGIQPGQCWNWFSGYKDPIANDPHVRADAVTTGTIPSITDIFGGASGSNSGVYLLGGGVLLLMAAFMGGK